MSFLVLILFIKKEIDLNEKNAIQNNIKKTIDNTDEQIKNLKIKLRY